MERGPLRAVSPLLVVPLPVLLSSWRQPLPVHLMAGLEAASISQGNQELDSRLRMPVQLCRPHPCSLDVSLSVEMGMSTLDAGVHQMPEHCVLWMGPWWCKSRPTFRANNQGS